MVIVDLVVNLAEARVYKKLQMNVSAHARITARLLPDGRRSMLLPVLRCLIETTWRAIPSFIPHPSFLVPHRSFLISYSLSLIPHLLSITSMGYSCVMHYKPQRGMLML